AREHRGTSGRRSDRRRAGSPGRRCRAMVGPRPTLAGGGLPARPSRGAPWSSYVVVPIFALANAGVGLSGHAIAEAATGRLGLGILASRIVGKPLGVTIAVLLALRWGLGSLPAGVHRGHVVVAGVVAGIPFTVSLFVAELALPPRLVEPATVAIMLAAVATGLLGFVLLRRI